jgi:hypothetical protein
MTHCNKKNKTTEEIDNYLELLENSMSTTFQRHKKIQKTNGDLDEIPKFNDYKLLLKYNYNLKQLKQMAKAHKLKLSGNKEELSLRIYTYLRLSIYAIVIQKLMRGCLQRKYNRFHGPAFIDKSLCTNTFDFLSMDELTSIPNSQFFSFKDDDGFIYGFDLLSLHNLIYQCNGAIKNPFNQKAIASKVIEDFRSMMRLSHVLKIPIFTEISDVTKEVSEAKSIELRTVKLFQTIDSLGNYTKPEWFLSLNRTQLIHFLKELIDIWEYRANLSIEMKKSICYPTGKPFIHLPHTNYLSTFNILDDIRKPILDALEKMVNTGVDKESKCLGAFYILGALTLVNTETATSMPWLFESVYHM